MSTHQHPHSRGGGRKATLILPGRDGGGFLTLPLAKGKCVTEVPRRHARLLTTMNLAYDEDVSLDLPMRGWRSAEVLCQAICRGFPSAFLDAEYTIHRYVSAIKAALQQAAGRRLLAEELLIEARRGLGFRIRPPGLVIRRPRGHERGQERGSSSSTN